MTRSVVSFREESPVAEIAALLTRHHITGAPVVDDDGHVLGIVSEMDVISRKGATAAEIMSGHVIAVTEDTGLDEIARILAGERIRRVPVLSAGRMVGLISRSDMLEFFATSHWACTTCGNFERGFEAPDSCSLCLGTAFRLERGSPGT